MDLDWGPGNGGETIKLYTCPICGAAVERHAREQHAEWHERLDYPLLVVRRAEPIIVDGKPVLGTGPDRWTERGIPYAK